MPDSQSQSIRPHLRELAPAPVGRHFGMGGKPAAAGTAAGNAAGVEEQEALALAEPAGRNWCKTWPPRDWLLRTDCKTIGPCQLP